MVEPEPAPALIKSTGSATLAPGKKKNNRLKLLAKKFLTKSSNLLAGKRIRETIARACSRETDPEPIVRACIRKTDLEPIARACIRKTDPEPIARACSRETDPGNDCKGL